MKTAFWLARAQINPDTFMKEVDEEKLIAELAVLTLFWEKTAKIDPSHKARNG